MCVRLLSNIQGAKHTAWNKLPEHNGGECTRNIIHYFCSQRYLWCVLFQRRSALRQEITGRERERFIYRSSLGPDKTRRYLDECNSIIQWPEFRPMPPPRSAPLTPLACCLLTHPGVELKFQITHRPTLALLARRRTQGWIGIETKLLSSRWRNSCRTHLLNCAGGKAQISHSLATVAIF